MTPSECFACMPDLPLPAEEAWEWRLPRALCGRHLVTARLADGEGLFERLDRLNMQSQVREGHSLGRALNPIWVRRDDGRVVRAWAAYGAGSCVFHEDRFGADNFFEARMMEFPDGADLLFALRHAQPWPSEDSIRADPMGSLLSAIVGVQGKPSLPRAPGAVYPIAAGFWNEQRAFDEYLARHALSSAADAEHFSTHLPANAFLVQLPRDPAEFHVRLFSLARKRFP